MRNLCRQILFTAYWPCTAKRVTLCKSITLDNCGRALHSDRSSDDLWIPYWLRSTSLSLLAQALNHWSCSQKLSLQAVLPWTKAETLARKSVLDFVPRSKGHVRFILGSKFYLFWTVFEDRKKGSTKTFPVPFLNNQILSCFLAFSELQAPQKHHNSSQDFVI